MDPNKFQRRFDLDWLRVLAILTVFIYHTTRFFNSEPWHIKNPVTYFPVDVMEMVLSNWLMALIFTISGASLFYALGQGGVGRFIKDKVLRLVVPLVTLGMLVFGSWQIYLERFAHGEFNGSYFQFLPDYFDGLYGHGGNFAWAGTHLWYLEMLFIFCLVFLPLFLWLKRGSGRGLMKKLGDLLSAPRALYLLALPAALSLILVDRANFFGSTGWGGGSILSHATFFISGFLIVSHDGLQKNIQRLRWLSLVLVVILMVILPILLVTVGEPAFGTLLFALGSALWGLWSWTWVLTILGFGMKYLNFNRPVLSHANEAVLPFYILHQPVLLSVGYFIVQWSIPAALKFLLIDAFSLIIIMTVYELVIRRLNLLRVLFGMKPLTKEPAVQIGRLSWQDRNSYNLDA
jgi:peptidoglycan/LPS O-acetylase OafA/YrhL